MSGHALGTADAARYQTLAPARKGPEVTTPSDADPPDDVGSSGNAGPSDDTDPLDDDPLDDDLWRDPGLDLDAIGLAEHFVSFTHAHPSAPQDQRQALGAWLDTLIAELDPAAGEPSAEEPPAADA